MWEGRCLYAPSLLSHWFPSPEAPKKTHEEGKGHLVIQSNCLIGFIKTQT